MTQPGWRSHATAIAMALILGALPFLELWWRGFAVYSEDTANLVYTFKRAWMDDLAAGRLQLWQPEVFMGIYRAADPVLGLYDPLNFVYWLHPGYGAMEISIVLRIWVAMLGGYVCAGALTPSPPLRALAACLFGLTGPIVSMYINFPYLAAGCWWPWALAAAMIPRPALRLPLLAAALGMVAIGGDIIGMAAGAGAVLVVRLAAFGPGRRGRDLAADTGAIVLASLAALIVFLPATEIMAASRRGVPLPFERATQFSLHPAQLAQLVLPGLWGSAAKFSFWGHAVQNAYSSPRFWGDSIYHGILPLLALGAAVPVLIHHRLARAAFAAAALLTVVSFGVHTPLYRLLWDFFPGADRFRYPAKFFILASPFLALALAWACVTAIERLRAEPPRTAWRVPAAAGVAAAFIIVLAMPIWGDEIRIRAHNRDRAIELVMRDMWRILAVCGAAAVMLFLAARRAAWRQHLPWAAAALVAADLIAGLPDLLSLPRESLFRAPHTAAALHGAGLRRVARDMNTDARPPILPSARMNPNWAMLEGIADVFGSTATRPRRFDALVHGPFYLKLDRVAPILGIDGVVTLADPGTREVRQHREQGTLKLLRVFDNENLQLNEVVRRTGLATLTWSIGIVADYAHAADWVFGTSPLPDAIIESDAVYLGGEPRLLDPALPEFAALQGIAAASPAMISVPLRAERPHNGELTIALQAPTPAVAVVREALATGWRAYLDGAEVPIFHANLLGRAVFVPPGQHTLHFVFAPPGFARGVIGSALAWLAIVILGIFAWRRRHRDSGAPKGAKPGNPP